jgi:hypothetical protein
MVNSMKNILLVLLLSKFSHAGNFTANFSGVEWWNQPEISDSFTLNSTLAQTALAIIQVVLVSTNVIGEYIFYIRSDNKLVRELRAKLRDLRKKNKDLRKEELSLSAMIFGDIVDYLKHGKKDYIKNDAELLARVKFIKDFLERRRRDTHVPKLASD